MTPTAVMGREGTVGGGIVRSSSTEANIMVHRPHKKWDKKEEEDKKYGFR